MVSTLKVAVVTGGHPYDVPGLTDMFRALPGIDAYVQHLEDFTADVAGRRAGYDVVLFYTMLKDTPTGEGPWYSQGIKAGLERLGETEQGIFLMHHALLAFPDWPLWHELVGIPDYGFQGYHAGQPVRVNVAQPDHPITRGIEAWEMIDETYLMNEPGADNEILLTIDHPKSMRACGWARHYRNARVFCLQSGHDLEAWSSEGFRAVVTRGVQWCAQQI